MATRKTHLYSQNLHKEREGERKREGGREREISSISSHKRERGKGVSVFEGGGGVSGLW